MSGRELPAGWVEVDFESLVSSAKNGLAKRRGNEGVEVPVLRLADFDGKRLAPIEPRTIQMTERERTDLSLKMGDILCVRVNGSANIVGRLSVFRQEGDWSFCDHFIRYRMESVVLPDYIERYFETVETRRHIESSFVSSAGQKTVNRSIIGGSRIRLAPLPEQHRIVGKIEALTTRSRRAREALDTLPALIDRYRQSILAATFRGDLSCDGNRERRSVTLGELVAEPTCNGISIKGTDTPPGVPALKLNALTDRGINYDARRYIPLEESRAQRIYVREKDFFVSRGNGSLDLVGRGALASSPPEPIVFPDTMIRIRLNQNIVLPEWFAFVWGAPQVRDQIRARVKTTAGIWKISQHDLSSITVDVPDVHTQAEELEKIRRGLDAIENCRVQFGVANSRLATLDQSILAKAFRGELVPQDPNDEPASVLLERIRAERATAGRAPRRGRRPKAAGGG